MALPTTSETREFANFADNGDGTSARYVKITGGLGSLLEGVEYDSIVASYPNVTTEVYEYRLGGVSGTLKATITVVYTTATKDFLSTVAVVKP